VSEKIIGGNFGNTHKGEKMSTTTITFLEAIFNVLNGYTTDDIKTTIGDSVNNNRTVSVRQLIRFLTTIKNTNLANQLEVVYNHIRPTINHNRDLKNFRTDAIDVGEFLEAVGNVVTSGTPTAKRRLTVAVNTAA
jgi:hypothetical protein